MIKSLFGLAPQLEDDGSLRPSKLALMLATSSTTDYAPQAAGSAPSHRSKVLVLCTEQKNMTMQNGALFSTGNHPVEALLPMLHLQSAGFELELVTPTGRPVVFEMWAMPTEDEAVMTLFKSLRAQLDTPTPLCSLVEELPEEPGPYAAVFVPGGHGAMLGIPEDRHVGTLLRWAHRQDLLTISICHGPGALLATTLSGEDFLYAGYRMAVFPDSVDEKTPLIGYLPGKMPWKLCAQLATRGAVIVNKKGDDTVCLDRSLLTGASPAASQKLGVEATRVLLERLR